MFNKFAILAIATMLFSGCYSNKVNPINYKNKITSKITIPQSCKNEYKFNLPSVAVINFTNNSTFDKAKISKKSSHGAVGLGFGVTGFVAGAKEGKSSVKRTVNSKLSTSLVPLVENIVHNIGGVKLVSRADLNKIDAELKLQDSGLLDPNSVVEFGFSSGVKYLITGSIGSVDFNHKNYSKYTAQISQATNNSQNEKVKLAAKLLDFGTTFLDGTTIKTSVTLKIIDVSTGKIIFTKNFREETKINSTKEPSYDQIVGGVKSAISKSLPALQDEFAKHFKEQGYITKLQYNQSNEILAQINIGKNFKTKQNDVFTLFTLEENIDPLTGVKSCDKIKLDTKLTATKHITHKHTWVKVEDTDISSIKILQLVQRIK